MAFLVGPVISTVNFNAIGLSGFLDYGGIAATSALAKSAWVRIVGAIVRLSVIVVAFRKAVMEPQFHRLHAEDSDALEVNLDGSSATALAETIGIGIDRPFEHSTLEATNYAQL